jgi:hypothetical protein
MKKHYRKENNCLNCCSIVAANYCSNCGQENLELKENFLHLLSHSVGHYFHFDSKFNQTIIPLLTKPGLLTLDYIKGKRARYLHPISMYMFISLVFFLIFFKFTYNVNTSAKQDRITSELLKDSVLSPIQKRIIDKGASPTENHTRENSLREYEAGQKKLPESKRDGWLKEQITRNYIKSSVDKHWSDSIIEQFRHSVPKMMFLMLPLFALILQVFFRKSDVFYINHLIHSVHLHSFVFLLWTLLILLRLIPGFNYIDGYIDFATFLFGCFYLFRSFRIVYGRSRKRTISKMIGISIFYGISIILVFTLGFIAILALN